MSEELSPMAQRMIHIANAWLALYAFRDGFDTYDIGIYLGVPEHVAQDHLQDGRNWFGGRKPNFVIPTDERDVSHDNRPQGEIIRLQDRQGRKTEEG